MNGKEIPKPVVFGLIAVVAAFAIFFVMRAGASSEIPNKNKIEVGSQAVPKYLLDQMPPEMRAKAEAQSKEMGTVTEKATQAGQGGAPAGGPPAAGAPAAGAPAAGQ